eukprot:6473784-Amphidinium_carterae.1
MVWNPRKRPFFYRVRGLNGEPAVATKRIMWPVGIGGKAGQIASRELEADVPMLLSRSAQAELGA